jgi:hypothetical protein
MRAKTGYEWANNRQDTCALKFVTSRPLILQFAVHFSIWRGSDVSRASARTGRERPASGQAMVALKIWLTRLSAGHASGMTGMS